MNISCRLTGLTIVFAAVAVLSGAAVEAKTHKHYRHYAKSQHYSAFRRAPGGTLIDSQGWRKRDNAIGWDNTCFNLDYMSSMYACGGGRR